MPRTKGGTVNPRTPQESPSTPRKGYYGRAKRHLQGRAPGASTNGQPVTPPATARTASANFARSGFQRIKTRAVPGTRRGAGPIRRFITALFRSPASRVDAKLLFDLGRCIFEPDAFGAIVRTRRSRRSRKPPFDRRRLSKEDRGTFPMSRGFLRLQAALASRAGQEQGVRQDQSLQAEISRPHSRRRRTEAGLE